MSYVPMESLKTPSKKTGKELLDFVKPKRAANTFAIVFVCFFVFLSYDFAKVIMHLLLTGNMPRSSKYNQYTCFYTICRKSNEKIPGIFNWCRYSNFFPYTDPVKVNTL